MTLTMDYTHDAPTREQVDATNGSLVLEFGTDWCGHCQAAQPLIASAFTRHPAVSHLKIEDGPGRPLGRSFGIKLWPTLIFLRNGQEVARVVRPQHAGAIADALGVLDPDAAQESSI